MTISYSLVTSPTHGTLSGEIPNLRYTPNANFVGDDSFQFGATDTHGAATVATIPISIEMTNTAPLADSLVLTTEQESVLAVNLTASDADEDALLYTLVATPTHGVVSGTEAALLYTPNTSFIGTDSFTYKANDGQADSAVTTVTIQVVAAPSVANVTGIVFGDKNGNGTPDGDEHGEAALQVTLTAKNSEATKANTQFVTLSNAVGLWHLEAVPFGSYTLRIESSGSTQIAAPVEQTVTVDQRGVEQTAPAAVKVTGRALFLPTVAK